VSVRLIIARRAVVPEIIEIEPVVGCYTQQVRQPVGEILYHDAQLFLTLLAVGLQLLGDYLEM
jgi:hypothetical protein